MTAGEVYNRALLLAEKISPSTGETDEYYKKQHLKEALILIEEAAAKFAYLEGALNKINLSINEHQDIFLPDYVLRYIIPYYVGAILCQQDGENDRYSVLITQYEDALANYKHTEGTVIDVYNVLDGLS